MLSGKQRVWQCDTQCVSVQAEGRCTERQASPMFGGRPLTCGQGDMLSTCSQKVGAACTLCAQACAVREAGRSGCGMPSHGLSWCGVRGRVWAPLMRVQPWLWCALPCMRACPSKCAPVAHTYRGHTRAHAHAHARAFTQSQHHPAACAACSAGASVLSWCKRAYLVQAALGSA